MQSKSCFKLLRKFLPSVCDEKRRCVFEHAEPRIKYLTTGIHIYTEKDLRRILYMLRLSRKLGSSFEVRIINWRIGVVDISTLAKIFQEINPEIVKSFYMITKPEDILKLDKILKPCVELTSLSLELFPAEKNDALQQKLANDVSLLIGHHPTLKRLVLRNFRDLLVGYWDKYRLPTSVVTLVLDDSILMHVDLEHGTDASIPSHIQDLTISNSLRSKSLSDIEGYLKFVESHAETLVSLDILLSNCEHQPTVDSLKRMAKRLAQFNKLQRFTYCVREVQDLLVILRDVMPLIAGIPSLNSYELSSDSDLHRYDRDFLQALQLAMKTICMGRKRPLDFATVTMDLDSAAEFEDGLPIVDYEDLLEVVGDQWHLPDFYDCEDDKEKDFQDDIPISEFEELCEVVPGA